MKFTPIIGFVLACFIATPSLAQWPGWLSGETWDIESARAIETNDDPYFSALQTGYLTQAEIARDYYNWSTAARLLAKSRAAAAGMRAETAPYALADGDIDPGSAPDLARAAQELGHYLGNPGAMLRAGHQIGDAQVYYDCWLEGVAGERNGPDVADCHEHYILAIQLVRDLANLPENMVVILPGEGGKIGGVELDQDNQKIDLDSAYAAAGTGKKFGNVPVLENEIQHAFEDAIGAKPPPARYFTLYFDRGETRIDTENFEEIIAIAAELQNRSSPEVIITGYTDASGGVRTNLGISRRRAQAVETAIMQELPSSDGIIFSIKAMGEADLVDPQNPDDARNRRVEVLVR